MKINGMRMSRRALLSVAVGLSIAFIGGPTGAFARDRSSFTIAVIPDTQNYIDFTHQKTEGFPFDASEMFLDQMKYIADNSVSNGGEIVFATSVGDVWQHQSRPIDPEHARRGLKAVPNPFMERLRFVPTEKVHDIEMPMARRGYRLLAGKLPFSVVPGNHDYDAMWTDSEHPPTNKVDSHSLNGLGMLHSGGLDNFRSVFGNGSEFFKGKPWYVDSHDGGADSAQIFEAGGYRFLHIGLQFDPPDETLEWAATVLKRYPGLPTIVSTHDFLSSTGERRPASVIDSQAVDPLHNNNPDIIWEKLVRKHDQIFLILCGHQHGQATRVDVNDFGHQVHQMLADYQGRWQTAKDVGVQSDEPGIMGVGDGWLRLLTFGLAETVPTLSVRTYSTHYKKFSTEIPEYAAWYRQFEQPRTSDEEFVRRDDFSVALSDFSKRFGPPSATK